MQRSTLEELARAPEGRYVAGETWAHFCADAGLWGVILWGRSDERHALELGRSLVLELRPPAQRHASIIDASRLDGADSRAFAAAERYLEHFGDALEQWVSRLALVRPSGLGGAIVAGAYEVLPKPYPVAVFDEATTAFGWLGREPHQASLLGTIYEEASGTPQVVGALRALLDANLRGLGVAEAASRLGLSERSLQRKLGEASTTFQDELGDARVRAARKLLIETDAPLTTIAFDVGCGSLQHFSALFRKRVKESPSAFRKRHRAK
jgi:AraC-like DNA-binding protein